VSRDTRNRILVASLLLFNDQGEPNTTINDIADELDISPGNLHYHFRRKADIVSALLAEFRADAARVLAPPAAGECGIDDFWLFLHGLLECTTAYRFLFRDMESLSEEHAVVARALRHFAKGLRGVFEIYLRGMADEGTLELSREDAAGVSRQLTVIAFFSDRFDTLIEGPRPADEAAVRAAAEILGVLKPLAAESAAQQLAALAAHYSQ